MSDAEFDVLILGGGPAGLAAGWALKEAGISFCVLEAEPVPGGNARTIEQDGFRFDTGPHRFHDQDPESSIRIKGLMQDDLREVVAPSRIYWRDRFFDFPLRPAQAIFRGGLSHAVKGVLDFAWATLSAPQTDEDFQMWAFRTFGKTLADTFLIPYSEKLWGLQAHLLSPDIAGRRLPGFSFWTVLRELVSPDPDPRHLEGRFFYPRLGYGRIMDAMAALIGPERIRCRHRITKVSAKGSLVGSVTCETPAGPKVLTGRVCVNTLPLGDFCRFLDPPAPQRMMEAASSLLYRDVLLIALFLEMERVSEAACTYFPDRKLLFSRCHEPGNRSPDMSPPGKTSLIVEYPCFAEDPVLGRDRSQLAGDLVSTLEKIGLIRSDRVLGHSDYYMRNAYPVYAKGYKTVLAPVMQHLAGYRNLWALGRGGEFFYGHVHDFVARAFSLAGELGEYLTGPGVR
jgi:protoporphyrinogen oxidase